MSHEAPTEETNGNVGTYGQEEKALVLPQVEKIKNASPAGGKPATQGKPKHFHKPRHQGPKKEGNGNAQPKPVDSQQKSEKKKPPVKKPQNNEGKVAAKPNRNPTGKAPVGIAPQRPVRKTKLTNEQARKRRSLFARSFYEVKVELAKLFMIPPLVVVLEDDSRRFMNHLQSNISWVWSTFRMGNGMETRWFRNVMDDIIVSDKEYSAVLAFNHLVLIALRPFTQLLNTTPIEYIQSPVTVRTDLFGSGTERFNGLLLAVLDNLKTTFSRNPADKTPEVIASYVYDRQYEAQKFIDSYRLSEEFLSKKEFYADLRTMINDLYGKNMGEDAELFKRGVQALVARLHGDLMGIFGKPEKKKTTETPSPKKRPDEGAGKMRGQQEVQSHKLTDTLADNKGFKGTMSDLRNLVKGAQEPSTAELATKKLQEDERLQPVDSVHKPNWVNTGLNCDPSLDGDGKLIPIEPSVNETVQEIAQDTSVAGQEQSLVTEAAVTDSAPVE